MIPGRTNSIAAKFEQQEKEAKKIPEKAPKRVKSWSSRASAGFQSVEKEESPKVSQLVKSDKWKSPEKSVFQSYNESKGTDYTAKLTGPTSTNRTQEKDVNNTNGFGHIGGGRFRSRDLSPDKKNEESFDKNASLSPLSPVSSTSPENRSEPATPKVRRL